MTDDPKTKALIRARDWFTRALVKGPDFPEPDWNEAGDLLVDILAALPECEAGT